MATVYKTESYYKQPVDIVNKLFDYDDEDGLSIKSGGTIGSDIDDISEGYEEIKNILMKNEEQKIYKLKDDKDYDDWNDGLFKASYLLNNNNNPLKTINKPLEIDSKNSFLKINRLTYNSSNNTNISSLEKQPSYQHFNNWKLHLQNYKETKGYKPTKIEPLIINGIKRKDVTPTTLNTNRDSIESDLNALPNNSLSSFNMPSINGYIASTKYFDVNKINAASSSNSVFQNRPTNESKMKINKEKEKTNDLVEQKIVGKEIKYTLNSIQANVTITVSNSKTQNLPIIEPNLQSLKNNSKKEIQQFENSLRPPPKPKLTYMRQNKPPNQKETVNIKRQPNNENFPLIKSLLNRAKNDIDKFTLARNSNISILNKVNNFTKQQNKLYQKPKPSQLDSKSTTEIQLNNYKKPPQETSESQLKMINEYHEISKILADRNKRDKLKSTELKEPKIMYLDNLKKEDEKKIFQVLRKDQRRVIAFYHRLNEKDLNNYDSKYSSNEPSRLDNISNIGKNIGMRQKIFI